MRDRIPDVSMRKAAIVAGVAYLLMFIPAIFANFFVLSGLVVPGDAATTAGNIAAHEMMFRGGIVSLLVVAVLDIVVALALYVFLRKVNATLSALGALFRVVYAAIFGVTLLNLVMALQLLSGADYLTAFEAGQLHARMMTFIEAFNSGWLIALVFFGLHLFFVGYLIIRSGYVPRILGVLLMIASLGYLVDSFGAFLLPGYAATISMYTFLGELVFPIWLLLKGGRSKGNKNAA